MKKTLLLLITMYSINNYAQVGINYQPTGTEKAEVIIDNTNILPSVKLKSASESITPGYVLVSDNSGNATWRNPEILEISTVNATYGTSNVINRFANLQTTHSSEYYISGIKVKLKPGKWAVVVNVKAEVVLISQQDASSPIIETPMSRNRTVWVRTTFADENTLDGIWTWRSPDIYLSNLASGEILGVDTETTVKGEMYIHNQTSSDKEYTLIYHVEFPLDIPYSTSYPRKGYRIKNFGAGASINGIDRVYAIRVQ